MRHMLTRRCKLAALASAGLLVSGAYSYGQTTVPVAVVSADKQTILQEVKITGTVTSPQVSQLSVATNGLIVGIHAEEGDRIQKGDSLLSLDDEIAKQDLAGAKAQFQQAEIVLADARRRLKEAESLGPKGGLAETVIEDLRSEVAEDGASLARFRADFARQKAILERHSLKAPFTGIISRRMVEVGEWVSPGTGVFELVATENLRLDFALAEDLLTRVTPDTKISFQLSALTGEVFQGRVSAIVPIADPGARTFLLRVNPETPVENMMPGLSVVATVHNPSNREAVVVPEDAIVRYPDGRIVVWVISRTEEGQIAKEKQVTAGNSFAGLVAISAGLDPGDQVVVQGNEALQNGQPVKIVPASGGR